MLRNIIGHAVYQLIILFVLLYAGPAIFAYPETHHGDYLRHTYTMVFNSFVLCQLFNEVNSRKVNSGLEARRGSAGFGRAGTGRAQ